MVMQDKPLIASQPIVMFRGEAMADRLKQFLIWMFLINAVSILILSFWMEGWGGACLRQWGTPAALVYAAAVLAPLNMIAAVSFFTCLNIWNSISAEKIGLPHLLASGVCTAIAAAPLIAGARNCSPGMVSKGALYLYVPLLLNEQAFLICFIAFLVAIGALVKKQDELDG
ncbi:hypothetical protein O166_19650 [Pseudogulbenkiania ferrooxidans EGD-HP2]|uniref:Uncharacterized protein n=2 Tax=Chromobacteriaceae TaxID=1499392 RepID=A0ABP2XS87_9NEIS|nr:hypothetical protein O166_19650 [Pseudogulbenkiania ferrooxidans EGD-HP2]